MIFLQNMINQNMQISSDMKTQRANDKIMVIEAKSKAYDIKAPHHAEIIKTTSDGIATTVEAVKDVAGVVNPTGRILDCVA